jgi:hypothetical protein
MLLDIAHSGWFWLWLFAVAMVWRIGTLLVEVVYGWWRVRHPQRTS